MQCEWRWRCRTSNWYSPAAAATVVRVLLQVNQIFSECEEPITKKQLAYMIAESHIHIEADEEVCSISRLFVWYPDDR